jgi:large subunit ribosomal protein L21
MKYAIVERGGKQYKAVEGSSIQVDTIPMEEGEQVTLDSVLLLVDGDNISVGTPKVDGAKVNTTILAHEKGRKVVIFKYRPRKRYRVKAGHRQKYTRLSVDSIELE